ncbi:MAG TPA: hypothetical protein VN081_04660 [Dongiaceae bacterium]|nr:hypothetical protein [Dongiaceae bacterium]
MWLALFGVALGLIAAVPAIILGTSPDWSDTGAILSASPGVVKTLADPIQLYVLMPICIWLLAVVYGYAVLYWIPGVTLINTLLAALYVGRSLNPKYKDETLSTTRWVNGVIDPRFSVVSSSNPAPLYQAAQWLVGADILSGRNMGQTAVSLLPVRGGRVASFLGNASLTVWSMMSLPLIRALWWLGLTYWVTTIWLLWPVSGTMAITIWTIVSIVLFSYSVYRIVKVVRQMSQSAPLKTKRQKRRA